MHACGLQSNFVQNRFEFLRVIALKARKLYAAIANLTYFTKNSREICKALLAKRIQLNRNLIH